MLKDIIESCGNDKNLVILALVAVAIYSLYTMGQSAENIITAVVSGLCGIATGRATAKP
ncbi:MAG: hypothetical protein WC637_00070 [Victivallales bacterium]|jgi:hypothetical protein